ncbi:FMN-dependent NADH-azoreductase [Polynucleobacter sp. AM-26B4]|uniref:FMN-dependent NADH-azoreductase n=1 Tax=Polynucleobacter sp. AM-26B4 TaxID=2689103 RepID=UPI001C0E4438|nr:NAD(P)H-dependent oxidoreductase [Polynucleobacter sp. AM-26B4]MBU3585892.1 NAD(P)H-dependent oxidoreductase [Polynucleobacter sp. AM-26B4]
MTKILQIKSSIFSAGGQSGQLTDTFVKNLVAKNANSEVIVRDFAKNGVPHLDEARFMSFMTKPEERSAEQKAVVAYSDALIKELKEADVIVLGLPMYNLGVPSNLKAYFDHIARAGETFNYTESGPAGLVTGKKAYVVATRGGNYQGTPYDTQTDYIKVFLGFIGITDVEFVYAEGLNMGEEPKTTALESARSQLEKKAA